MKDPWKIVIYFFGVIFGAALLAPPLFHLGTTLGDAWGLRQFSTSGFSRYFNRSVLIMAVLLFWPLFRSFQIRSIADLGLVSNPKRWGDLANGLLWGFCGFLLLAGLLFLLDWAEWKDQTRLARLGNVLATAVVVSLIEEAFFRGGLQGVLLRKTSPRFAIGFTACLFSIVHFLKPPDGRGFTHETVHWLSGFELLPSCLAGFTDPVALLGGFTTLLLVGWILGRSTWLTRSLFLAIGLHAGWILALEGFKVVATRPTEHLPWIGRDLLTGLLPILLLLLTLIVLELYAGKRRSSSVAEK